jgi:hypothetical protein
MLYTAGQWRPGTGVPGTAGSVKSVRVRQNQESAWGTVASRISPERQRSYDHAGLEPARCSGGCVGDEIRYARRARTRHATAAHQVMI